MVMQKIFHITRPFKSVLLTLTLKECVYLINHLSIVIGRTADCSWKSPNCLFTLY